MKRLILISLICFGICGLAYAVTPRTDIIEARAMIISFDRINTGSPPIVLHVYGERRDTNGKLDNINDFTDWDDMPQAWQDDLLPTLKRISKAFNNKYANEDTETF